MARIRTVKPAFFRDLKVAQLSPEARLTFIGLWTYVDDEGRGLDEPRLLKADLWPLDEQVTLKVLEGHLQDLVRLGMLVRYETSGKKVLSVVNWAKHQRINRPQPSELPAPPEVTDSVNDHGTFSERSVNDHGTLTGGRERKGRDIHAARERSVNDHGTTTWLTPYFDAWVSQYGGKPNPKELASHLAPIRAEIGDAELLVRWRRYLASTEARFNPRASKFAAVHGSYGEPDVKVMTDENGIDRPHRKNEAGEWVAA